MIDDRQIGQLQAGFAARGFLRAGECGKQQQAQKGCRSSVGTLQKYPAPVLRTPIPWRAKKKATTSESALTARKKYTQYCAVTIPPNGKSVVEITNGSGKRDVISGKRVIRRLSPESNAVE